MKPRLAAGLLALIITAGSATVVNAQCAFRHPKKANALKGNFVQAFVSCGNPGGNSPNTTTEGGIPSCRPPETLSAEPSQPTGWRWDPAAGQGQVQIKSAKIVPPITPADGTDLAIKVKLKGVVDIGGPANGTGALATVTRATVNDRMNGDMTIVDFPANFAVTVIDGKANVKTTADALLNGISQPALPHCSSIEAVSITIADANGNTFSNLGLFNP